MIQLLRFNNHTSAILLFERNPHVPENLPDGVSSRTCKRICMFAFALTFAPQHPTHTHTCSHTASTQKSTRTRTDTRKSTRTWTRTSFATRSHSHTCVTMHSPFSHALAHTHSQAPLTQYTHSRKYSDTCSRSVQYTRTGHFLHTHAHAHGNTCTHTHAHTHGLAQRSG